MKKFLSAMVAVIAAVVLAVVAAACGATKVEGKTYVPDSMSYTLPSELKENTVVKAFFDGLFPAEIPEAQKEAGKIEFKENNVVTMYAHDAYYVQDGNTVSVKESESATLVTVTFKVSGNKLTAKADGSSYVEANPLF